MLPYSLYLHIPFCAQRCGYCDFNTYAGLEAYIPRYVSALCAEVEWIASCAGERLPVHTVYFGGGTPSLLPAAQIEHILVALQSAFDLQAELELTIEANPGTLSRPYLRELRSLGVNRLSLGVQSANPGELRLLERIHSFPQAAQSVAWARQAGFDNLSLDLIFGLPEQPLSAWQNTLRLVLELNPEHLSLYALTIEPDTPFGGWARRGLLTMPDPDLAADMYEWAAEQLDVVGYAQYEISNWAKVGAACRHNLQYWRNRPYLGLGAGAHGYAAGFRTENTLSPVEYIRRFQPTADGRLEDDACGFLSKTSEVLKTSEVWRERSLGFPRTPATHAIHAIDRQTEIGETLMMGLRLTQEGVSAASFNVRFGQSLEQIFGAQITRLQRLGLLEWADYAGENVLRLTARGRLLGNQVFMEFI